MKKKFAWLLAIPVLLGAGYLSLQLRPTTVSEAQQNQLASLTSNPGQEDVDALDRVLANYVNEDGLVDYVALQGDRADLDSYNASIALVGEDTFNQWSEDQQIAYLINAYNSLTLKSIIKDEPITKSIRNLIGVWKINQHPLMQKKITLDAIEHAVLRVNYDEPRIHMALVCAAISCPFLRTEAYRGDQLDEQLDDQVRIFLDREEAFKIDREKGEVQISAIFDWFGEDWVPQYGTSEGFAGSDNERAVLNFISNYVSEEDKAYLKAGDYKVTYAFYDWALNTQG